MNRRQLDKWERLAESMRVERDRRRELALAEAEADRWVRPRSLATQSKPNKQVLEFTDEQMMIAIASLEKNSVE